MQQKQIYCHAAREGARLEKTSKHIFTLQSRVLQQAGSGQKRPATPGAKAHEQQRIFKNEVTIETPLVQEMQFADSLLCPRFLWVLAQWMQGKWLSSEAGISLAEIYVTFIEQTGWVVPVNVGSWRQEQLPECWRSKVPSAWLQETSYANLLLCRTTFAKQLTIFLHSFKLLLRLLNIPCACCRGPALTSLGHGAPVSMVTMAPYAACHEGFRILK